MLALNGLRINTSLKDDSNEGKFVKFYQEKVEFLKKQGEEFTFTYCPHHVTPADPMNPRDRPKMPMPFSILAKQTFRNKDMELEVQYYESSVLQKNGGYDYSPISLTIKPTMTLSTKRNMDMIFYLIYVSSRCELMAEFPDQNIVRNPAYFVVYDHIKSLETEEAEERLIVEVKLALSGGDKGLPIGKIRMLAANYGIPGSTTMKDVEVRQALRSKILFQKQNRYDFNLINQFLGSFSLGDSIEIGSAIQIAKDKKIIVHVKKAPTNPEAHWRYVDGKVEICKTGVSEPNEALKDWLERYPDEAAKLQEVVKKSLEG